MVLGAPRATSRLGPRLLNAVPKTGPGGRPRGPRVWIKTKSPHRRPNITPPAEEALPSMLTATTKILSRSVHDKETPPPPRLWSLHMGPWLGYRLGRPGRALGGGGLLRRGPRVPSLCGAGRAVEGLVAEADDHAAVGREDAVMAIAREAPARIDRGRPRRAIVLAEHHQATSLVGIFAEEAGELLAVGRTEDEGTSHLQATATTRQDWWCRSSICSQVERGGSPWTRIPKFLLCA